MTSLFFRRILIFISIYLALSIAGQFSVVQQIHSGIFTRTLQPIHNMVNSTFHAVFHPVIGQEQASDVAIELRVKPMQPSGRAQMKMTVNIYQMVWIPTIILIALFIMTPGPLLGKSWRFLLCFLIYYLILGFYFQYRFGVSAAQAGGEAYSDTSTLSNVFGFRGLLEPLVGLVIISWLLATFKLWQSAIDSIKSKL